MIQGGWSPGVPAVVPKGEATLSVWSKDGLRSWSGFPRAINIALAVICVSIVVFWATLESEHSPFSIAGSFSGIEVARLDAGRMGAPGPESASIEDSSRAENSDLEGPPKVQKPSTQSRGSLSAEGLSKPALPEPSPGDSSAVEVSSVRISAQENIAASPISGDSAEAKAPLAQALPDSSSGSGAVSTVAASPEAVQSLPDDPSSTGAGAASSVSPAELKPPHAVSSESGGVSTTLESPGKKPGEKPEGESGEEPGARPGEKPVEKPGARPGEMPGEKRFLASPPAEAPQHGGAHASSSASGGSHDAASAGKVAATKGELSAPRPALAKGGLGALKGLPIASDADLARGPDPKRPSKCAAKCLEHGTCDEEIGKCFCVAPYGGPDCSEAAMPSCYLAPNYFTTCRNIATCECVVECQRLFLPFESFTCMRGTRPDGTKITNLTEIYDGPQYGVRWNRELTEVLPPLYDAPIEPRRQFTSPKECPGMCNGFAACLRDTHTCACSWGTWGVGCEQPHPIYGAPCVNECSGRGECVLGVCRCNKGYFGLDCSLFIDSKGTTRILPRAPYFWSDAIPPLLPASARPLIYVYFLPPHLNTWQSVFSSGLDWKEPAWFMESVHNSIHRTANPKDADFFYIPLFTRHRNGNKGNVITAAIDYVSKRWPYYNRRDGTDHFILTNSDWANCEQQGIWGERSPHLRNLTTVTLWGLAQNLHLEDQDPCFIPGHDIVMPPDQGLGVMRMAPDFVSNPEEREGPRETLLYFRGYFAMDQQPWGRGNYTWSFGVRQAFYRLYKGKRNETGIWMDDAKDGAGPVYLSRMLKSIFCLTPAGFGWGMRATQAVLMGCIPVVIQPNVYQAFEGDGLDWNEFGLVLAMGDIPHIEKILRSLSPEALRKKRDAMKRVRMNFVWSSPHYNPLQYLGPKSQAAKAVELFKNDAFASIMRAFRMRLEKNRRLRRIPKS